MLEVIQEAALLGKKDLALIEGLSDELTKAFTKGQIFRTRTEMEVSVLNEVKFPTAPSRYWQALREQVVMFNELVFLSFEARKNQVEIKILLRDIEEENDVLQKELYRIEKERKEFILASQVRTAKARIREIRDWSKIKEREAGSMSPEDLLDPGKHQLISYTKRWIKQSMIMGNNGSPAERQNLLGQLRSGIQASIKAGVLNNVLEGFPASLQERVRSDYSVTENLDG